MSTRHHNHIGIHLENYTGVAPLIVNGVRTYYANSAGDPNSPPVPTFTDLAVGDIFIDVGTGVRWRREALIWVNTEGAGGADTNTYPIVGTTFIPISSQIQMLFSDATPDLFISGFPVMRNYCHEAATGGDAVAVYTVNLPTPMHPTAGGWIPCTVAVRGVVRQECGDGTEWNVVDVNTIELTMTVANGDPIVVYYPSFLP